MKTSNIGMFTVAASIAFVGALWAGVPLAVLAPTLILLACPLMMMFMMSGMHGNHDAERRDTDARRDEQTHH